MIHVYAPAPMEVQIVRAHCTTCQRSRRMVTTLYEWYSGELTCLRCGESWNEDGRRERPFARGWRPRAIRSAWRSYVRYRNAVNAPTTHVGPLKPPHPSQAPETP